MEVVVAAVVVVEDVVTVRILGRLVGKTKEEDVGLLWTRKGDGGRRLRLKRFFLSCLCSWTFPVPGAAEAAAAERRRLSTGCSFLFWLGLNSPDSLVLGAAPAAVVVAAVVTAGSSSSGASAADAVERDTASSNRSSARRRHPDVHMVLPSPLSLKAEKKV